jgi:hypothetical protein
MIAIFASSTIRRNHPARKTKAEGCYSDAGTGRDRNRDDVVKLLEDHPHSHMSGGSIEVHEFLSMPGM